MNAPFQIMSATGNGLLSVPVEVAEEAIRQHLAAADEFGGDVVEASLNRAAARADAIVGRRTGRADAVGVAPAPILVDQFRKIIETPFQAAEGMNPAIVPQQAFTRPGFEFTQIARITVAGEVKNARSAGSVPYVNEQIEAELFPVTHWVNAFKVDQWEQASNLNNYVQLASLRMRTARTVQMLAASKRVFSGDTITGQPGILNHPNIAKTYGSVAYKLAATAGTDVVTDFLTARDNVQANSKGVGKATVCLMAANLVRVLRRKQLSTTYPLRTVLKELEEVAGDLRIVAVEALNGAGPNGEDACVFYNDQDPDSLFNDVPQLPTFLAPQIQGFESHVFVWMSHGGVQAITAYNDAIHFVPQS